MSSEGDTFPSSSHFPPFPFFFSYLVKQPSSSLSSFSSLLRASAPASHQHQHLGSARRVKALGVAGGGVIIHHICVQFVRMSVCLCVNLGAFRLLCVYSLSFQITSFHASPAIWLLGCPLLASLGAVCNYELLSVFLSHTTTLQRELS